MKIKKTFLASLLSLTIFFALDSISVLAQGGVDPPGGGGIDNPGLNIKIDNPFKKGIGDSLFGLLKAIINDIIMPIGGVLAVLAFIYSGFLFVTAQGNETKLGNAKRALLYTAIGTAVLLGAWVLANVVCQTIGLLGGPICPT